MADCVDGRSANRCSDEVREHCVFCGDIDDAYSKAVAGRHELCNYCEAGNIERHYSAYSRHGAKFQRGSKSFSYKHEACDEHNKPLDMLCCEHYDIICQRCWSENHDNCYVKPFIYMDPLDCKMFWDKQNDFLMNVNAAKEQKMKDIEERRIASMREINSNLKTTIVKLKRQAKNLKKDVLELFMEIKSELQDVYNKFTKAFQAMDRALKSMTERRPNREWQMKEESHKLVFLLQNLKSRSKEIHRPIKTLNVSYAWSKLHTYIDDLFAKDAVWGEEIYVEYVEEKDIDLSKSLEVSRCHEEEHNPLKLSNPEFRVRKWNISDTRASKLEPILVQTKTDKDDCCITGLSVTNNGHLLMSDCYNKSVKLFSKQGKYITSCEIPGEPWDIAITDDNEAAVTLWDNQKAIRLLKFTETSLQLNREIKVKNRVSGIAAVGDCIAVTSDNNIPAVILMNKEAHTLWTTQFDSSGKRLFALPGYIIHRKIDGVSCLMVSDKEKHTITTLDAKTGDVLKVSSMFKGGPNGLSFDPFDNIYVAKSYAIEVCLFSSNMHDHTSLLNQQNEIKRPQAIAFNSWTSELYISSWKSNSLERFKVIYK